jgi:morphogenetic protein associated with SpoVID
MNVHIVQKGDTLWKIARQNGVSFDELKRMNAHLANPDYIVPGMKIFLPDKAVGKKEEIVHPFNDGKPPKTVVLSEKEKVVEMPVMEVPVVELPKEKVVETPPMPVYSAPVQPTPIPQPIQMPHYHAIQYVPITKNFYSVQQAAQIHAAAPPPPPPPPPPPMREESPMVEEIVEEHFEQPMEMPMMVYPHFTGPLCGCPPIEFCPPVFPCDPCMHPMHMFPMAPFPTPYFGMQPGMYGTIPGMGYGQMMPGMMYDQSMSGIMPEQMVQGVMEEEMSPEFMPEQMMGYPSEMPLMETPELAGQMVGNPEHAGWVLESSSDEPSSFLEKFEHHHHHHHQAPGAYGYPATGQVAGAYGYPATGQVAGAYGHPVPGQVAGAYGYPAVGQVAGAFAPQGAPMYPEYYGLEQQGYPMTAAPYNYNPYMMPGHFGYGPGSCNCY